MYTRFAGKASREVAGAAAYVEHEKNGADNFTLAENPVVLGTLEHPANGLQRGRQIRDTFGRSDARHCGITAHSFSHPRRAGFGAGP